MASLLFFILCQEEEPPYCLMHLREGLDKTCSASFSHFSAGNMRPLSTCDFAGLGSPAETCSYSVLPLDKLLVSGSLVLRCSLLLSNEAIFSKPSLLVLIVVFSLHLPIFLSKLFRTQTKQRRKVISEPLKS